VSEGETATPAVPQIQTQAQAVNPLKNPSYPQRTHIGERARWQDLARKCGARVEAARRKLDAVSAIAPERPALERLYAQMLGARDQVAESARRLPGETGDLYEEDHHRLEEALAALDRIEARWDGRG
jgi:hypothetical protein